VIARASVLMAVVSLVVGACSGAGATPSGTAEWSAAPSSTGARSDLTIYAAASLKDVLDKAKAAYEAVHPDITLTISTDASSALEAQLEQGAPADAFLSADTRNPQLLADKGLVDGLPVRFAGNILTIVVPAADPARISTPADLANAGVKIIAAGDAVPVTGYATQLVENLAREAGYPADFVAAYAANVVSREDNARAIIAKVELGEGDAGIVYLTDAKASTRVRMIDVPDDANVPATYAGVVVKESPNPGAAHAFLTWFAGPGGQAILAEFGFLPPS
jgi:molybdate transport system substrate-binding protein